MGWLAYGLVHIGFFYHMWFGNFQQQGIDLGLPVGTPITSLSDGVVVGAGYYGGGGVVTIRTEGVGDVYYQHLGYIDPSIRLCNYYSNWKCNNQHIKFLERIGWSDAECGYHFWGNPCYYYSNGPHIEVGINPIYCGLWGPCQHPGPSLNPYWWLRSRLYYNSIVQKQKQHCKNVVLQICLRNGFNKTDCTIRKCYL